MHTKTILLVEDNPSDIDLAKRAFAKAKIVNPLVIAEDGKEALDYLFHTGSYEGVTELPCLVLLDLKLPIVNGLDVLSRIRENPITRRLPVVIMTSSQEDDDIAQSYDRGVNSYIRKPVNFLQFAEAVNQLSTYWLILNEAPPPVNIKS